MKRQILSSDEGTTRFTWDDGAYVLVESKTPTESRICVRPRDEARAYYRASLGRGMKPSDVVEVPDPLPPPRGAQLKLW